MSPSRLPALLAAFAFSSLLAIGGCLPEGGGVDALAMVCEDSCRWAGDGECDDGGSGSDYSVCEMGTDCRDCGERYEDEVPIDEEEYVPARSGGGGSCSSFSFTCQYCSGQGTCSGGCPSSCSSLCADACSSGGCGSVVSCN